MKKLNFNQLVFLMILLFNYFTYSQEVKPAPVTLGDPIMKTAFHKNIMQDINFMVLGDNNTKQGFSYEYGEKKLNCP